MSGQHHRASTRAVARGMLPLLDRFDLPAELLWAHRAASGNVNDEIVEIPHDLPGKCSALLIGQVWPQDPPRVGEGASANLLRQSDRRRGTLIGLIPRRTHGACRANQNRSRRGTGDALGAAAGMEADMSAMGS